MRLDKSAPTTIAASGSHLRRDTAIPSLDGIRAIAIALVFFAHSGLQNLVPGGLGVTIFFVLSGYLITTLLRAEYCATQTIDFSMFYLRRLLRLMPPLLLVISAAVLLSQLGVIDGHFSGTGLLSVLFYFGNYFVIAHDFAGIPAGVGVVWSLAVEEHFYLFFPPLAVLLLRFCNRRGSVQILSVLCLAVLGWRCLLALHGAAEPYLNMATDTRVDSILVGCIMALGCNPWLDPVAQRSSLAHAALGIGCVLILVGSLLYREDFFRLSLRYSVQSLAVAPLIYLAVVRAETAPFRWLNARPMRYLGSVSYSIYLSHQVVLFFVERHWPQLNWVTTITITAALTLALAEPMRRWIERPCADLRRHLHQRRRALHAHAETLPANPT